MDKKFKLLEPIDFTPEIIEQVLDLGMRSGTWKESDVDYYKEQFLNPSNISIVYLNESDLALGYILAKPHNEAVQDYSTEDPAIGKSQLDMFYVDIVIVDKIVSGKSLGMKLILEMIKEANRRGVSKFSMHCRTINGLSRIVQHRFKDGVLVIRRIDEYTDCNNEPFDYMEIVVVI